MSKIFATALLVAFIVGISKAQHSLISPDPRCPRFLSLRPCRLEDVTRCRICPPWHICCPNACGSSCIPIPKPVNPKCPPVKPGQVGTCAICQWCPRGQICCPNGCGSSCVTPRCRWCDPCRNFVCEATPGATCRSICSFWGCRKIISFMGVRLTQKDCDCPKGMPPVQCLIDPCDGKVCDSNPQAVCVPNYCGGCNFSFIDPNNGADVTDECFPDRK